MKSTLKLPSRKFDFGDYARTFSSRQLGIVVGICWNPLHKTWLYRFKDGEKWWLEAELEEVENE